jgi:transposase
LTAILLEPISKSRSRSIESKSRAVYATDEQWEPIRRHFSAEHAAGDLPGRKPIPGRKVLEPVLRILNASVRRLTLPQSYPKYRGVRRRFQRRCLNELIRAAFTEPQRHQERAATAFAHVVPWCDRATAARSSSNDRDLKFFS